MPMLRGGKNDARKCVGGNSCGVPMRKPTISPSGFGHDAERARRLQRLLECRAAGGRHLVGSREQRLALTVAAVALGEQRRRRRRGGVAG